MDVHDFPIPVKLGWVLVNYRDLENYIEAVYGRKVSIPATYEKGNDSFLTLDLLFVAKGTVDMEFHDKDMAEWQESNDLYVDLESVMCDLVLRGVFPAANYLIEISW
jgi:hypothetical protein